MDQTDQNISDATRLMQVRERHNNATRGLAEARKQTDASDEIRTWVSSLDCTMTEKMKANVLSIIAHHDLVWSAMRASFGIEEAVTQQAILALEERLGGSDA